MKLTDSEKAGYLVIDYIKYMRNLIGKKPLL